MSPAASASSSPASAPSSSCERIARVGRASAAAASSTVRAAGDSRANRVWTSPLHAPGHWQRLIGSEVTAASDQLATDLERVERVAAGKLLQAHERRACGVEAEPGHEKLMHSTETQRPDAEPPYPFVAQHPFQLERRAPSDLDPAGRYDQDWLLAEPAQGEPQRRRGRGVNPLQVVDGQKERSPGRDHAERRQGCDADRPLVERVLGRVTVSARAARPPSRAAAAPGAPARHHRCPDRAGLRAPRTPIELPSPLARSSASATLFRSRYRALGARARSSRLPPHPRSRSPGARGSDDSIASTNTPSS